MVYGGLVLHADDWLDYRIVSDGIMLAVEIEVVRDSIGELLSDRLKQSLEYECTEPDLEFLFHPKGIVDVDMELVVSFWGNGVMSANRMLLSFDWSDLGVKYNRCIGRQASCPSPDAFCTLLPR